MISDQAVGQLVREAFADFTGAMQAGDTDELRRLIGDVFTLTHITGYVQPGDEWLAEMRQGQFVYHHIDVRDLRLSMEGDKVRLSARTLTDARVYDGRNEWRLDLALVYARHGDHWVAERATATLWS